MSERKVLNKYYPPDYDASKIPRVKREKNRQFTIRLMVPFNIRCITCGEYIYRGKKFNARKEDVIGHTYLGIQIYRFYIKCTKCLAEITFLTDPENQDYAMGNGAIRNFESLRLAEKQAETEAKAKADAEENNPMQVLENRTRDSRREMDILETLEDLKERNTANFNGVDPKTLRNVEEEYKKQLELLEEQEDEAEIKKMFAHRHTPLDDANFIEEEVVTFKKQKLEADVEIKLEEVEVDEEALRLAQAQQPSISLFRKTAADASLSQPIVGQLKRNNVGSFIKKKPVEMKSEQCEKVVVVVDAKAPAATNSLLSMMSSYADSDEDSGSGD